MSLTIYVVKPGDTIPGIASRLGVTSSDLIRANRERFITRSPDVLYVGERLRLHIESDYDHARRRFVETGDWEWLERMTDAVVGTAGLEPA